MKNDENFPDALNRCSDFAEIFDLVKAAVRATTGRHRVGLILGLADLPEHIGAFHQLGSNFIIMNKKLLEQVVAAGNKKLINAYVFHIVLHEYIHSLGCVNEGETYALTHAISEEVLGESHPATKIARYGIGTVFANIPKMEYGDSEIREGIDIVENFESDNLDYFG